MLALVYFAGVAVILVVMLGLFTNSLWHGDIPRGLWPFAEGIISCLVLAWGWPFFLVLALWLAITSVRIDRRWKRIREEGEMHR
jgi:hypothetical protein